VGAFVVIILVIDFKLVSKIESSNPLTCVSDGHWQCGWRWWFQKLLMNWFVILDSLSSHYVMM